MSPDKTTMRIKRRTLLQSLLAVPAFALFSLQQKDVRPESHVDEFVEINGWILKRSELA